MKRFFFTIYFSVAITGFANAQNWYVSGNGSDSNDGKTLATAFRSLQKAANEVKPGDEVLIGNGNYTNNDKSNGSAVLSITRSGTKDAWITWKALKGQHPEIHPSGWSGIQITGSYHIIEGLTILGGNDSLTLVKAQEDAKKVVPDPTFNTNGILVDGRKKESAEKPHHLIIKNCNIGKCPGGGIALIETDYVTVENCNVFDNAWFMRYGGSGISVLNNWAFDDNPSYHYIIRGNFVWENKTMVAWERIGSLSDGNGIILDVSDQDENGATNPNSAAIVKQTDKPIQAPKAKRPEWKGSTLVTNNVCAFNGGSGIHTFRTKNVDILNNTTYHNGSIVGYPEIFANHSEKIRFLNNIVVTRPGGKVTVTNEKNKEITWDYNLYSKAQKYFTGDHDILGDPHFVKESNQRMEANFHLKPGSLAIGSGTTKLESQPILQLLWNPSHSNPKKINRGAYFE